jgi:Ca2+-binding RTX toxin-like protein
LHGGIGNDVLYGGAGNDTFVFDTALSADSNVDLITDFKFGVDADKISLSHGVFASLATASGTLGASDFGFVSDGTGAATLFGSGVHIIYDSQTGNLFYDADGGNTVSGRTLFATLNSGAGHPSVGASDIVVGA